MPLRLSALPRRRQHLDGTTHAEVLRIWAPNLETIDIEVQAPFQHVRQIVGAEFGRRAFTQNMNNVHKLVDLIVVELAATLGDVLVIAQLAVEDLIAKELLRRFGTLPARLHLAHHGGVTGLDKYGRVARVVVVGRPATSRSQGERLAELLRGQAVRVVPDGDGDRWPSMTAGIRMADGTGRAVRQPRHPDPLVEAVRWSLTEGAVVQGIGRPRGVRRPPNWPVVITVLNELALPLTVAEVVKWSAAQPTRAAVAVAEAALTGRALPLAPADLHAARPDLFISAEAVRLALKREKGGQTPIKEASYYYRSLTPLSGNDYLLPARYRKAGGRGSLAAALVPLEGGRGALEAIVGPLAVYIQAEQERSAEPDAAPGVPATSPEQSADRPAIEAEPLLPERGTSDWDVPDQRLELMVAGSRSIDVIDIPCALNFSQAASDGARQQPRPAGSQAVAEPDNMPCKVFVLRDAARYQGDVGVM